ncbi:MAG: ATP-binding protein [Caulobacteraceae bacterium]
MADRLALALEAAGAGVFELDFERQTFWCSEDFVRLIGRRMSDAEALAGPWPIHHRDDVEHVDATISTAMRDHIDAVFDARVVLPDGSSRWINWRVKTRCSADGVLSSMVGLALNIEERKSQERALLDTRREAEANAERLTLALRATGAGAFETNLAAKSFWSSPEFDRIVGRTLTFEESACPRWPMIHPDDVDRVEHALNSQASLILEPVEWRVVLPSGEVRWVESNGCIYLGADGTHDRITGTVLDIDERKRQELNLIEAERAASAAAEAKSQFLTNMSHEIRTPMNGVLGILGLLNKEQLSDEARQMVAEAEGCGQMLAQLLNDVIDFSRIDAGRLELSPEPTDVAAVLRSVTELLRPQAEGKSLELTTRIEGGDGWAMIDPVRLRQGLFNLIGNAIKFTIDGRVEARLEIADDGAGQKRLRFEIEGSGVGIPADLQATLFQRFQQADGSTARRFGGSGLGLVITRTRAELMGGEVGFTSVEGRGSTFWLDVPTPAAERPNAADTECLASLEGLNILVVEDNATNRLVATKILEGLGAQVTTADDGILGVEAVTAMTFDLVLMDVQMPRMDGVEATRTIRALDGPVSRVPIVGLTANVMLHQWQEYRAAGMDGVASKPISPRALFTEIARVLSEVEAASLAA